MTSTLSHYFHLHSQKRPDDLERIGHALNFKTSTAQAYAQAHYVSFVFKAVLYVALLPVAETLSLVGRICLSHSASFQKTVEKQLKAEALNKQVQDVLQAWDRPIAPVPATPLSEGEPHIDEHHETSISLAELINDESASFEAIWVAARERLASSDKLQPLIESFSSERLKAFLSNRLITNSGTICVSLRNLPNFETLDADKQALLISHIFNGKYFNAQEGLQRLVANEESFNQVIRSEHLDKRALLAIDYSGRLSALSENAMLKAVFAELEKTPATFDQLQATALAEEDRLNTEVTSFIDDWLMPRVEANIAEGLAQEKAYQIIADELVTEETDAQLRALLQELAAQTTQQTAAIVFKQACHNVATRLTKTAMQSACAAVVQQLTEATTQKEQLKANWREVSAGSAGANPEAFKALVNNPQIFAQAIANIAAEEALCLGNALEVANPEKCLAILNLVDVTGDQFDAPLGIDFVNRSDKVQLAVAGLEKFSLLALSNTWHQWAEAASKAKKGPKGADPEGAQAVLDASALAHLDKFKRFINHPNVSAKTIIEVGKTMHWGVSGALSIADPIKKAAILQHSDLKFANLSFVDMGFIKAHEANKIRAAIADCPRFTKKVINTIQNAQGLYVDSLLRDVSAKTFAHIVFQGGGTDHSLIELIRNRSYNKHFIAALETETCPRNILAHFSPRAQERIIIDWQPKTAAIYALSQAQKIEGKPSILPHFEEVLSLWSEPCKREDILRAMNLLMQQDGPRASVTDIYQTSLIALQKAEATANIPNRVKEFQATLGGSNPLTESFSQSLSDLPRWALKKLTYDCTQNTHLQVRLILELNNEQLIDVLDLVWTDASLLPVSNKSAQAVISKIKSLIAYTQILGDTKAQRSAHPSAAPDMNSHNPCSHVLEILAYHQTEEGQFPYLSLVLQVLSGETTPDNTQLLYRLIDGRLRKSDKGYRSPMKWSHSVMDTPRTLIRSLCNLLTPQPPTPSADAAFAARTPSPRRHSRSASVSLNGSPSFEASQLPATASALSPIPCRLEGQGDFTEDGATLSAPKTPLRNLVLREEAPTSYRAFVISTMTAMRPETIEGYLAHLDAQGDKQNWLNLISVILSAQKYEGLEKKIALILTAAEKHLDLAELGSCFCDTEFMRLANSGGEYDQAALVKIFIGYLYKAVDSSLLATHIELLNEANESFCKAVFIFIFQNQENSQVQELALALIKDLKAMEKFTEKLENAQFDGVFIKMCRDQLNEPGLTGLLVLLMGILPEKVLANSATPLRGVASRAVQAQFPDSPAVKNDSSNPPYLSSKQVTSFRNKLILMKIMNGVEDSQRLVEILLAITNRNMMAAALRALNRSENPNKSEILRSVMPRACALLKPIIEGPEESEDAHYRLIDTITSPESLSVALSYLQSDETADPLALQALLSGCGERGQAPLEWLSKLDLTTTTLEWIFSSANEHIADFQKEAFLLATLENKNPQITITAWAKAPSRIRENAERRVSTENLIRIAKTLADHPNHPLFSVAVARSLRERASSSFSLPMVVQSSSIKAAHIVKIMEACRRSIAYESLPKVLLALQSRTDLQGELDSIKTAIIKSLEGHEYYCMQVFNGASLRMFIEDIVRLNPDALKEFVAHLREEEQEHLAIHSNIQTLQAIGNAYRKGFSYRQKLDYMASCIKGPRWQEAEQAEALQALLGPEYIPQKVVRPAASSASSSISPLGSSPQHIRPEGSPHTPLSRTQPPWGIEPDSGHSTGHDDSLNAGTIPRTLHRTGSDSRLDDMVMTPARGGVLEVTPPHLSPRKTREEAKSVLSQRPTEPLAQSMHKRSAAQSFQKLEVEDILTQLSKEGAVNEPAINLFITAAKETLGRAGEKTILDKLTAIITKAQECSALLCTALIVGVMADESLRDRVINKELAQDLIMNLADPNTGKLPESLKGLTQYAFS